MQGLKPLNVKSKTLYELNKLTAAVNTADMDLKKLWSVAEYAEAEDAEQLVRLARNIGCFTFIEGATSYAEVGEFVTKQQRSGTAGQSKA